MKRIAVIEDNPDNRLLFCALLEEHFDVLEYASGPEALERLAEDQPHCVMLDISLPGMDGLEVLKRLRANDELRSLPVIAVTAHAMSGDRERFLEHGFDDYLSKPILDDELLINLLNKWIESPRPSDD